MGTRLLLLLLLLGLSLLWGSLQALTCFKCDLVNAAGGCVRGKGVCQTGDSKQCFLKKVYAGDRLLSGYQGCRGLCISMSLFKQGIWVDSKCCRDTSFCNKL